MPTLQYVDLRTDSTARSFVKDKIIHVGFATRAGELMSLEGPNRYAPDDALITGSTGDRRVASYKRFDTKYVPADASLAQGQADAYCNRPSMVLTKQMHEVFSMACSKAGDILRDQAGDQVLQYTPGDYGVVQTWCFTKAYHST